MNEILKVLLFSLMSYIILFIISKLLGKKQIAELDFIDYVTGISIGSIAAEMATETEEPFYYYVIAMSVFFLSDLAVTVLGRKNNFFKRFLRGVPIILINKGQVDFEQLKKSNIDFYDLLGLARAKGYFDLSEIEYAVFENNGELSILPSDDKRQLKKEDFENIPDEKPSLTTYLVVDGEISPFALEQIGKSKEWLMSELSYRVVDMKKVLYVVYDNETEQIDIIEK